MLCGFSTPINLVLYQTVFYSSCPSIVKLFSKIMDPYKQFHVHVFFSEDLLLSTE